MLPQFSAVVADTLEAANLKEASHGRVALRCAYLALGPAG